jgi:hypothetical protein
MDRINLEKYKHGRYCAQCFRKQPKGTGDGMVRKNRCNFSKKGARNVMNQSVRNAGSFTTKKSQAQKLNF